MSSFSAQYLSDELQRVGIDLGSCFDADSVKKRLSFVNWNKIESENMVYFESYIPKVDYSLYGFDCLDLEGIVEEADNPYPGASLLKHGFLPFAMSGGGDAYTIDLYGGGVYGFIKSDYVDKDFLNGEQVVPNYSNMKNGLSQPGIRGLSLSEFSKQLVENELIVQEKGYEFANQSIVL